VTNTQPQYSKTHKLNKIRSIKNERNNNEKDFDFGADKIINFEATLADLLREKFRYEIPHIFFYYPSPQDVLNQTISQ